MPFAGSAVSLTAPLQTVCLAAALAAFWLSDAGTLLAFGLPIPELAKVAVYSLVGIAPIGWLLAESVLLTHGCAQGVDPPRTAGSVFALSTVGKVGGALLTS